MEISWFIDFLMGAMHVIFRRSKNAIGGSGSLLKISSNFSRSARRSCRFYLSFRIFSSYFPRELSAKSRNIFSEESDKLSYWVFSSSIFLDKIFNISLSTSSGETSPEKPSPRSPIIFEEIRRIFLGECFERNLFGWYGEMWYFWRTFLGIGFGRNVLGYRFLRNSRRKFWRIFLGDCFGCNFLGGSWFWFERNFGEYFRRIGFFVGEFGRFFFGEIRRIF